MNLLRQILKPSRIKKVAFPIDPSLVQKKHQPYKPNASLGNRLANIYRNWRLYSDFSPTRGGRELSRRLKDYSAQHKDSLLGLGANALNTFAVDPARSLFDAGLALPQFILSDKLPETKKDVSKAGYDIANAALSAIPLTRAAKSVMNWTKALRSSGKILNTSLPKATTPSKIVNTLNSGKVQIGLPIAAVASEVALGDTHPVSKVLNTPSAAASYLPNKVENAMKQEKAIDLADLEDRFSSDHINKWFKHIGNNKYLPSDLYTNKYKQIKSLNLPQEEENAKLINLNKKVDMNKLNDLPIYYWWDKLAQLLQQ
jgi:hypothetical protein